MDKEKQTVAAPPHSAPKKGHYLRLVIAVVIIFALGILIGYFFGMHGQQQQTAMNMRQTPTPSSIPSSQVSVNPDCPTISSTPVVGENNIEKTLEFTGAVEKYRVQVTIPSNWNAAIASSYENKPCEVMSYELKSGDNQSILNIVYSGETVGWPLPTDAVSIKQIDSEEEIIRYYGNEGTISGYFYHNNTLKPQSGYEDYRMSSGFILNKDKRFAALDVYLIYSGSESKKNSALQVADKIVSSLSLK